MAYTYDESIFSDLHKDAYGFRPSSASYEAWAAMTPDEKQAEWDYLCAALERTMDEDARREAAAVERFEKRVMETMAVGAKDRATAIRWILEGMELSEMDYCYGGSYICFELGLPDSMKEEFNPICYTLMKQAA